MIETVPLTPDHLRAIAVHARGLAASHYAYASWLDQHGYAERAAHIRAVGDCAAARGDGAVEDLAVWNQTHPSAAGA